MKIFMTSETFLPTIGGAEIHVKEIYESIEKNKDKIKLLTLETKKSSLDKEINIISTNDLSSWLLLQVIY